MHLHHSHDHGHSHAPPSATRAFVVGIALNAGFVLVEAAAGIFSHSLALLADAGHNLSDVLGLLLAWGASYLARQRPSERRTYGLGRTSILSALANALLLYVAVGAIGLEAIGRLARPQPVLPATMIAVAAIGAVINTLTALLFVSGRKHDLNMRAAFLHMAADAAVSVGVVLGGIGIALTGQQWIDPLLSLIIGAMIAVSTWDLLWPALELTLDTVPRGIDVQAVRAYLSGLDGVEAVHDLHIWALSTTDTALTTHLVKPDAQVDDDWLSAIACELHDRFGIAHATIQVENGGGSSPCRLAPDDVI
jgi:cobalt-zinc-cadmium efflux system protein